MALEEKEKNMEMSISLSTGSNFIIYIIKECRVFETVSKSTLFSSTQNKVILVVVFNSQGSSVLPQLVM